MAVEGRGVSVRKLPNGRFRAKLKSGRVDVASRVFDTQREARAWLSRERAALDGGVDPRAGRERVRSLMHRWLAVRRTTVAAKTYRADLDVLRLTPTSLLAVHVSAVSGREVARAFEQLLAVGMAESSVVRYRASLSSFFAWCVREKVILANPVLGVRVPKQSREVDEMDPFTEAEVEVVHAQWAERSPHLADVLLVLCWTGLRWAEARSMRVEDLMQVPTPGLLVRRSQPEGQAVKATKGRRTRRVPLADRVLPIVLRFSEGKDPGELLFTSAGGARLHRTSVLRSVQWSTTGHGRRIHDLRHTAACLWLARGVDPGTVQAWMGHESIATTNRYLHFLGTGADLAGLDRLNATPGGTRGARKGVGSE